MYHVVKYPSGDRLDSFRRLSAARLHLPFGVGVVVIFDDQGRGHGWYDTNRRAKVSPQPFEWCPIQQHGFTPMQYH